MHQPLLKTHKDNFILHLTGESLILTWWATAEAVVVAAVAEGMLEYTLDVVKLEPRERNIRIKRDAKSKI